MVDVVMNTSPELSERDTKRFEITSIPAYLFYEDFMDSSDLEEVVLDDARQPIKERDFYEMIVRVIADASVRPSYLLRGAGIPSLYDAVFKFLSVRVLPLYDSSIGIPSLGSWTHVYYDDLLQNMLVQNKLTLRKLWSDVSMNGANASVKDILSLLKSYKSLHIAPEANSWCILQMMGALPILPFPPEVADSDIKAPPPPVDEAEGATAALAAIPDEGPPPETAEVLELPLEPVNPRLKFNVIPTLGDLKSIYFDPTCLLVTVDFDDFVEMFTKVVASDIWLSDKDKKQIATEAAATAALETLEPSPSEPILDSVEDISKDLQEMVIDIDVRGEPLTAEQLVTRLGNLLKQDLAQ